MIDMLYVATLEHFLIFKIVDGRLTACRLWENKNGWLGCGFHDMSVGTAWTGVTVYSFSWRGPGNGEFTSIMSGGGVGGGWRARFC